MNSAANAPTPRRRVPLAVKLVYTAFLAVLIPVYLHSYGPTNFLYFCDVALLLTLAGIWLESPLLVSMPAVGILIPQLLWIVDFVAGFFGFHPLHIAEYMFDDHKSLFLRGLSLFHGWLPLLLVWLIWRLGYDRRALIAWTPLAWALLLVCYFFMPGPGSHPEDSIVPVNINYVFGLSDQKAQSWMSPHLYFAMVMLVLPLGIFWPTHVGLTKWFASRR